MGNAPAFVTRGMSRCHTLARVNFADAITSARPGGNAKNSYGDGLDMAALMNGISATTAEELVDQLAARLGPVPINDGSRAEMAAYVGASGGLSGLTTAQLDTKIRGLVQGLAHTPWNRKPAGAPHFVKNP